MRRLYYTLIFTLCSINLLYAATEECNPTPRIMKLLPNLETLFAVELCIPEDFVLIKESNSSDEFFWGPKNLDKACIDNLRLISEPLIHVSKTNGIKSFENIVQMVAEMKKSFPKQCVTTMSQWGSYPLISIQMTIGLDISYSAYVGLNDDSGTVLLFQLVFPSKKEFGNGNSPSNEDLILWTNFLNKTKPLK